MMDRDTYLSAINAPGVGTFGVEWQTTARPAAAHKARVLRKVTTAMCLTGVEYAKLTVNNDTETGALPWGEWAQYPYLVAHKGTEYARVYTVDGTVKTTYLIDGDVATRDDFLALLTPSQRETKRPKGGTLTIKLANMRLVGEPRSVAL